MEYSLLAIAKNSDISGNFQPLQDTNSLDPGLLSVAACCLYYTHADRLGFNMAQGPTFIEPAESQRKDTP